MAFAKIFVGLLQWKTTSEDLRRYFERFGEVINAYVIYNSSTGRSRGFGFVTFRNAESAARALEHPYPTIDGRIINCDHANATQKGSSSDQAEILSSIPLQQYQPTPQYYPPYLWDPISRQYYYLCYRNPLYSYPMPMSYYQNMMQQNDQGNTVIVDNADTITIVECDQGQVEVRVAGEEDSNIREDEDSTKELDKEAVEEENEVVELSDDADEQNGDIKQDKDTMKEVDKEAIEEEEDKP